jgi:hypothetical protein
LAEVTSFSSQPFSLLELSLLALSVSPPILTFSLYQLLLTSFGQATLLKLFLSHVTKKFKAKIHEANEIRI